METLHSKKMLYVEMNQTALLVVGNDNEWRQFLNYLKASKVTTNVAAEEVAREYLKDYYHRNKKSEGNTNSTTSTTRSCILLPQKEKELKGMKRYHQCVTRIMQPKRLAIQTRNNITNVVKKKFIFTPSEQNTAVKDTSILSEDINLRAFCIQNESD